MKLRLDILVLVLL